MSHELQICCAMLSLSDKYQAVVTEAFNSTVKPVLSGHSKRRPKIDFQDQLSFNAGQKYCRMLQGEHSAILSTFIKLPVVIKIFVLSIFEWSLKTGLTVLQIYTDNLLNNDNLYSDKL